MSEVRTLQVKARPLWNDSGVTVEAGERLRITASGEWTDWWEPSDPEGFIRPHTKLVEGLRRRPDANWFALIGCIGRSLDHTFVVGHGTELAAPASGRLYFFANDIGLMHWNNKGHLDVTVETGPAA